MNTDNLDDQFDALRESLGDSNFSIQAARQKIAAAQHPDPEVTSEDLEAQLRELREFLPDSHFSDEAAREAIEAAAENLFSSEKKE